MKTNSLQRCPPKQSTTDSATGELGVGTSVPAGAAVNTSLTATDYVSLTIDGLTVTATTALLLLLYYNY